jgi:hypothetical protein
MKKSTFSKIVLLIAISILFATCSKDDDVTPNEEPAEGWRIKEIVYFVDDDLAGKVTFSYIDDKLTQFLWNDYDDDDEFQFIYNYDLFEYGVITSVMWGNKPDGSLYEMFDFEYKFEDGLLIKEIRDGINEDPGYVNSYRFEYDSNDRIKSIYLDEDSSYPESYRFTYNGNKKSELYRTDEDGIEYKDLKYSYDGDLLKKVIELKENGEEDDRGIEFEYDSNDRVIVIKEIYSANNNFYDEYAISYDSNSNPSIIEGNIWGENNAGELEQSTYKWQLEFEKGNSSFDFIPIEDGIYAWNLINGYPWFWCFD